MGCENSKPDEGEAYQETTFWSKGGGDDDEDVSDEAGFAGCVSKVSQLEKKPPPTSEEILAEPKVALAGEHQAAAERYAADCKEKMIVLLAKDDPKSASVKEVMDYIQGEAGSDKETRKQQSKVVTEWLVEALQAAPFSQALATLVKQLLGTYMYTVNLAFNGQWNPLRDACSIYMETLGTIALEPLYAQHNLQKALSNEVLAHYYTAHPQSPLGNQKATQALAFPELYASLREELDFEDPATMAEHIAAIAELFLASLLHAGFEEKMMGIMAALGAEWCSCTVADTKGFARVIVKLFKDYCSRPSPRTQFILDPLRSLITGPNALAVHAILHTVSKTFGGVLQLKNGFDLDAKGRAARCHLLLINVTTVEDSGKTLAELLAGEGTQATFSALRASTGHGNPQSRWETLCDNMMEALQGIAAKNGAAGNAKVGIAVEVQVTMDVYSDVRGRAHYGYDVMRAYSVNDVLANFQGYSDVATMMKEGDATSLWSACFRGQLVVAKQFAANGSSVNELDPDDRRGESALYTAAENDHVDVVGWLASAGANIDQPRTSGDGVTALIAASQQGHVEVVKALVRANANIDQARTDCGSTPLFMASQVGHVEVVKVLLRANAKIDKSRTSDGGTPLYIASMFGHTEVVAVLVGANANLDQATTDDHTTALYWAAKNGHVDVTKELLAAGANRLVETDFGTAVVAAAKHGHGEIVALLN